MRVANPFVALGEHGEDEPTPARPLPSWLVPSREPSHGAGATSPIVKDPHPESGARVPIAKPVGHGHGHDGQPAIAAPPQAPLVIERLPEGALSADEARALRAELAAARATIAEDAIAMASLRRELLAASEADLVQLATAIAERVVRRELRIDPELVAKWAHEGIAALGERDEITVAVSDDVASSMPEGRFQALLGEGITLVVDRELPRGRCEVRGRHGRYDASVEARMAALVDALSAGGE